MNLSWYAEFAKPVVKDSSGYRFGLFVVNFSDHHIFCESAGDAQDIGIFVHSIKYGTKKISMDPDVGLLRNWQWSQWWLFGSGGFLLLTPETSLCVFQNVCLHVRPEIRRR